VTGGSPRALAGRTRRGPCADGSTVTAAYTEEESGDITVLTREQIQVLADQMRESTAVTVTLGDDADTYRVRAETTRNGILNLVGLPLSGVQNTVTQLGIIIAVVSLVGILIAVFLATWIVRLALRPLVRVIETAARVSELPLDRGEVSLVERVPTSDTDPRTEVGRVGSALNRMLDHVDVALETRQASERKVRQFVADASHELRTPLASIRGYAELNRRSDQELPPDALHPLGRIESESVRMTGLVEDLLLLARLDEGRELPDEPVEAVGDAARLHQVFANLLANARIHTPPETTVGVALALENDRAIVTVTDDGPGIPENLQSTLFERFARGDSSRYRGTGSTGLGLAIARAVVAAHHGEIDVESRPGFTCFRVSLPLT